MPAQEFALLPHHPHPHPHPSALRTSTGQSVINANWVIDRPGRFQAAGTEFTYRRPNEIRSRAGESITAPGPLSQALHLYVSVAAQATAAELEAPRRANMLMNEPSR